MDNFKSSFPIPVVAELQRLGESVSPEEALEYLNMPKNMQVYQSPILPEPEELIKYEGAAKSLNAILDMLKRKVAGEEVAPMSLLELGAEDVKLVNQVLGEGEVSATIEGEIRIDIQETIFVGVWRVLAHRNGTLFYDTIEVGEMAKVLLENATKDMYEPRTIPAVDLPENLLNVPVLLQEIVSHSDTWKPGQDAHTVNLTLLPLTPVDIAFLDDQLGTGRVTILSRGYGNCRITNTLTPNTWRVVYYNSMDSVILNVVEVCDIPVVACAAQEDLESSLDRMQEVLEWFEQTS